MSNNDVHMLYIHYQAIWKKDNLIIRNDQRKDILQPICKGLGNNFVNNITEASWTIIRDQFGGFDFWYKRNESMIKIPDTSTIIKHMKAS